MWLMQDEVRARYEAIAGMRPTAEQQAAYEQHLSRRAQGAGQSGPQSLRTAGDVAEIRVEGVLTKNPDLWAWLLGGGNTTYSDLRESIAMAQTDPSVKSVRIVVDSPGGQADGLFDVFAALEDLKAVKPVSVRALSAHSAAYGLAAVAGPIEAQNVASRFGSVGVAVSYRLSDEIVDLTNSDSPDKRPDLSTDEGRAVVVRELDAMFELFADAIARGRGLATKRVVEDFGRGASFVASEAKRRGMIDSIAGAAPSALGASALLQGASAPTETAVSETKTPDAVELTADAQTAEPVEAADTVTIEVVEPTAVITEAERSEVFNAVAAEVAADAAEIATEVEATAATLDETHADITALAADFAAVTAERDQLAASVQELTARVNRFEASAWLDGEAKARGLALSDEKREKWIGMSLTSGRDVVVEILDASNAPPQGDPMATAAKRGAAPKDLVEATNALCAEVRAGMIASGKFGANPASHLVVAQAQKLALTRFPELAEQRA